MLRGSIFEAKGISPRCTKKTSKNQQKTLNIDEKSKKSLFPKLKPTKNDKNFIF